MTTNTAVLRKLAKMKTYYSKQDKELGRQPSCGRSSLAKALELDSPNVIVGWEKRKKVPSWRVSAVDALYAKLFE